MKLSTGLAALDLKQIPDFVRQAEALGFEGLYMGETSANPMLALTLVAEHTTKMRFGTGILLAFARSPMVTAYDAWTLQKFSGGRFTLGLGSQVKAHIERRFNMPFDPPGPRMRDQIHALRAIWDCWQNGTQLNYQGEFYRFNLMTPFFNPGPIDHPTIPIQCAGVNPYMCQMAGEHANGLHLHGFNTPRYTREVILPAVAAGLAKSGRSRSEFETLAPVMVVTGADEAEMAANKKAVCKQIAFYASTPQYQVVMEFSGWAETGSRLRRMAKAGQWDEMGDLITDDIVNEMAVVAPLDKLGEAVRKHWDGLLDNISFYHSRPLSDEAFWKRTVAALKE